MNLISKTRGKPCTKQEKSLYSETKGHRLEGMHQLETVVLSLKYSWSDPVPGILMPYPVT